MPPSRRKSKRAASDPRQANSPDATSPAVAAEDASSAPQSPAGRRAFAITAFAGPFAVYAATLCRTIYWGDGIELTAAAHILGVPHPTGYPLFMLLGRAAMALIPFGEPAARMNLLCAVAGAGAALMMFLLLRRIFLGWMGEAMRSERDAATAALAASLVFAFSRSQWFHSVTAEVYTLHMLFVLAMFWRFVCWRQERRECDLLWLTGLAALAVTHHTTAIFAAPLAVMAWADWALARRRERLHGATPPPARKLLLSAAIIFFIPLLLYLYLPLRAATGPAINCGDPDSLGRFLWVLTGGDYKSQYFMRFDPVTPFTAANYPDFFEMRLRGFIDVAGNDFLMIFAEARGAKLALFLAVAALALFGLLYVSKADRPAAVGWVLYLAGALLFVFTYNVSDFGAFYYPLWALAWPAAVIGGLMLLAQLCGMISGMPPSRTAALALLLPAAAALALNWPVCNKATYRGASEYARDILDAVEPGAMIVTIGDNDIYPLWYATIVEKRRPDVIVVGSNFLSSAWYETFFTAEQKAKWTLPIEQRELMFKEKFYGLIIGQLIKPNLERGPVYTTFLDEELVKNFRLEFVSVELIKSDDLAHLDSFLPDPPILIRLHALQ